MIFGNKVTSKIVGTKNLNNCILNEFSYIQTQKTKVTLIKAPRGGLEFQKYFFGSDWYLEKKPRGCDNLGTWFQTTSPTMILKWNITL